MQTQQVVHGLSQSADEWQIAEAGLQGRAGPAAGIRGSLGRWAPSNPADVILLAFLSMPSIPRAQEHAA